MQIIDTIPIEQAVNIPAFRDKKHMVLLKKQNYRCKYCSAMASYVQIVYNHNTKQVDVRIVGRDMASNKKRFTVDHIIPRSKGGPNSWENYQCLCNECNAKKADKILNERI